MSREVGSAISLSCPSETNIPTEFNLLLSQSTNNTFLSAAVGEAMIDNPGKNAAKSRMGAVSDNSDKERRLDEQTARDVGFKGGP